MKRRYLMERQGFQLGRRVLSAGALALLAFQSPVAAQQTTAPEAQAAEPQPNTILGFEVTPLRGTFLVREDLNIRSKPDTKGSKVGRFDEGSRIQVIAQAKGSWVAVTDQAGEPIGFVYKPVLIPLLDEDVKSDITGEIARSDGTKCDYLIRFDTRTPIDGQPFESIDYQAILRCIRDERPLVFTVPMFISEGPFNAKSRAVHQIGMDILELVREYDRFFSTNVLFDREKGLVKFDNVSIRNYAKNPEPSTRPAEDLKAALQGALEMAVESWTPRAWEDLTNALSGKQEG